MGSVMEMWKPKMSMPELEKLATNIVQRSFGPLSYPDGSGCLRGVSEEDREALKNLFKKAHVYRYPKADNVVDAVIFGEQDETVDCFDITKWYVLLIKRGREGEPFYGCWAFPGGFMDRTENLDATVMRELQEETGLTDLDEVSPAVRIPLTQVGTFSKPDRDPRGRVISTAYFTLVKKNKVTVTAADDAAEIGWFPVDDLPPLAFDHEDILEVAWERLKKETR